MNSNIALPRMGWDRYFLEIASVVAKRATCPRLAVGAVITLNNRILTTGYNGAPPGKPHCTEVGCHTFSDHCTRSVHAEENALQQLKETSIKAKMYITHKPCNNCLTAAHRYFITDENIIWEKDYGN